MHLRAKAHHRTAARQTASAGNTILTFPFKRLLGLSGDDSKSFFLAFAPF